MSKSLGDFRVNKTVVCRFNTTGLTSGAPITLAGTPAVLCYKNSTTESASTGITLTVDYDSRTGLHHVAIDMSANASFFATANDFDIVLTAGTVDGVSVVGMVVGTFSVENRSALNPTVADRTLDVSVGGEAGMDWANVGSQSTTVGLSGTTVKANDASGNALATASALDSTYTAAVAASGFASAAQTILADGTYGNAALSGRIPAALTSDGLMKTDALRINGVLTTSVVAVGAYLGNATAAIAVDASGRLDIIKIAGTTQTAKDLGAINVTNLNTLSGHDPGATLGTSTLTQTQVVGGAYALNSASFAFAGALPLTTQQKADVTAAVPTAVQNNASAALLKQLFFTDGTIRVSTSTTTTTVTINSVDLGSIQGMQILVKTTLGWELHGIKSNLVTGGNSLITLTEAMNGTFVPDAAGDFYVVNWPQSLWGKVLASAGSGTIVGTGARVVDSSGNAIPTAAQIVTALLVDLLSSSDFDTTGSFGKLIKDYLNAAVGSVPAAVWDLTTSGHVTAGTFGAQVKTLLDLIATYLDTEIAAIKARTDNLPNDPADASDIAALFAAISAKLPTALAADGSIKASLESIFGLIPAVTQFARGLLGCTVGTIGIGSTTTSLVTSSLLPLATAVDQFKAKVVTFDRNTTTAALRGQSTVISANTTGASAALTVTALTTAPVSGDTFTIS